LKPEILLQSKSCPSSISSSFSLPPSSSGVILVGNERCFQSSIYP
jgi:hypothetical protein